MYRDGIKSWHATVCHQGKSGHKNTACKAMMALFRMCKVSSDVQQYCCVFCCHKKATYFQRDKYGTKLADVSFYK